LMVSQDFVIHIDSIEVLDEVLSEPTSELLRFMGGTSGDFMVIGASGKMGPSMCRMLRRALDTLGEKGRRVFGLARFSDKNVRKRLEEWGVEVLSVDLFDEADVRDLPNAENVVYMVGQKFGTKGNEYLTWAINTYLPGVVARRFSESRFCVFSTGNVYPLVAVDSGGATEETAPQPVGEYAQSRLGGERVFKYFSVKNHTKMVIIRLNYAYELRYGVLVDIARRVQQGIPVDLSMGYVNVIWQRDANDIAIRALGIADSPPEVLNVTGPETLAVRSLAHRFGMLLGVEPVFTNWEEPTALLSNASKMVRLFGTPQIGVETGIKWVGEWVRNRMPIYDKPTHFEARNGVF